MSRMKDQEWDKEKARVKAVAERVIKECGLGFWRVDLEWWGEPIPSNNPDLPSGFVVIGRATVQWEYTKVTFDFNLYETRELNDEDLLNVVTHEVCHALVAEMREPWNIKHEERVVEQITKALIWTAEAAERRGYERAKREFVRNKRKKKK